MHEALCRSSGTTLDSVHAEDGPPITHRTSGLKKAPNEAGRTDECRYRRHHGYAFPAPSFDGARSCFHPVPTFIPRRTRVRIGAFLPVPTDRPERRVSVRLGDLRLGDPQWARCAFVSSALNGKVRPWADLQRRWSIRSC